MKNIKQLFRRRPDLLEKPEVQELIEYTQELEGQVMERKVEDNYDKEHMLKSMLFDILTSCKEYEENKLLQDRYPELYEKVDADSLVRNLMDYIITMNTKNDLRL
jgi:membrane-bound lytic murein transglycosylase MltF